MPMHDWTRVEAGIFHAFHHRWISALSDTLNGGTLPAGCVMVPLEATYATAFSVMPRRWQAVLARDADA